MKNVEVGARLARPTDEALLGVPSQVDLSSRRARDFGTVVRAPGVYRPQEDTRLLAAVLARITPLDGCDVLDYCTGSGALALVAARLGAARVTAVDVSVRATASAWVNARIRRLPVRVRRGGLSAAVSGGPYDLVLANPPYVPCPAGHGRRSDGGCRRWDAGADGRAVLDPLCEHTAELLRPGGRVLIVQSEFANSETTLSQLRGAGLSARVLTRVRIPFGPVLRGRAEYLTSHGLAAAGQSFEELVVVRGDKPR
ncbi:HemK2/MTQ2 family protein methyltransferase [Rhodococcus kronopolitis]|uniref:HemK2/MTQ2 family protein methyltransferase n=1 Tax=Rhodococcus kronopolitis TaxID=1460226 RepID=A0ABV9FSZ5_9NOCA